MHRQFYHSHLAPFSTVIKNGIEVRQKWSEVSAAAEDEVGFFFLRDDAFQYRNVSQV